MAAASSSQSLIAKSNLLSQARIVLASQSPRRREIFDLLGLSGQYDIVVSDFEENLNKAEYTPGTYAETNAIYKARDVASKILEDHPLVVVGSDTIVDLDGVILEKPRSEEEAKTMLRRLSGRSHLVHSGVGIVTCFGEMDAGAVSREEVTFHETTKVFFGTLSDEEIEAYVKSGEPLDKAGSYGIQGLGGQFVDRIEGCYFNVMGFPMRRFTVALSSILDTAKLKGKLN
eukprot:CAMPEP_0185781134 /NCGR_PEP_ID=MMETSP1174-20130828/101312_1 /TAXON_ID=35687 /ORGANISM="Dictyocha speculum, Strain CCMP1381" /LENGTH=229 /DNA_ID=CAMNT_0028470997 /DNA_START=133 /DNA_END=822 /DNA_ORIENTATION=+